MDVQHVYVYTSHRGRHDENEEREEGGHEVVRILDLRVPLRLLRGNLRGGGGVVDWLGPSRSLHLQSVVVPQH